MTWTRVLTALVLMPVVIVLVLCTPTWVVAIAIAVITILALWEYFALGAAIGHRAYRLWTVCCAIILIAQQNYITPFFGFVAARKVERMASSVVPPSYSVVRLSVALSPVSLFVLFVLGLAVVTLFTRRPLVEALPSAGISSSALFLVALPLSFAIRLHGLSQQGPRLLLFALAITWAGDTVAYFAGRSFGKHALAPHISPKKTWEGSIAGLAGSLLIAYAFHYWLTIPVPHLLALATLGNIAGQIGDLLESACKRSAGVKDSGGLLPGHGGMLDRIDALILCVPVIWYYVVLVNPSQ
jgi:phosphatidate cytidylyltransferase